MPVERPGAALCTAGAPEPDIPYHVRKAFGGVSEEVVSLLYQGSDAERYRDKGNCCHLPVLFSGFVSGRYGLCHVV